MKTALISLLLLFSAQTFAVKQAKQACHAAGETSDQSNFAVICNGTIKYINYSKKQAQACAKKLNSGHSECTTSQRLKTQN